MRGILLGVVTLFVAGCAPPTWEAEVDTPTERLVLEAPWDVEVLGYHLRVEAPPLPTADRTLKIAVEGEWRAGSPAPSEPPVLGVLLPGSTYLVPFTGPGVTPFASRADPCDGEPTCERDVLALLTRARPYGPDAAAAGPVLASVTTALRLQDEGEEAPDGVHLSLERRDVWHAQQEAGGQTVLSAGAPTGEHTLTLTLESEADLALGLRVSSRWSPASPDGPYPEYQVVLEGPTGARLLFRPGFEQRSERAGQHDFELLRPGQLCGSWGCSGPVPLTLRFETGPGWEGELVLDWAVRADAFGFGADPAELNLAHR